VTFLFLSFITELKIYRSERKPDQHVAGFLRVTEKRCVTKHNALFLNTGNALKITKKINLNITRKWIGICGIEDEM
jgi:hypothetical protein